MLHCFLSLLLKEPTVSSAQTFDGERYVTLTPHRVSQWLAGSLGTELPLLAHKLETSGCSTKPFLCDINFK